MFVTYNERFARLLQHQWVDDFVDTGLAKGTYRT
jgi:hypothetical protein